MISGVHISSSEMVIQKDNTPAGKSPKFSKGQIVSAKVLKQLANGNTQFLIDGNKITAKTAMLLKPGEDVQLQVLQEKDSIVLKLIGPAQKITANQISSLISYFSKNNTLPDFSKIESAALKELFSQAALKSDKADPQFLPRLINNSGVMLENKIASLISKESSSINLKTGLELLLSQDMKGTALRELFTQPSATSDAFKAASMFSETIENFQLLNHQSSESGRYLLPFPIFSESAFRFGQLLIDTGAKSDSKETENKKVIKISFLLDMTNLGPVRADFSILNKEINGRFLLSDDETRSYMESLIPLLKKQLDQVEYHLCQIECQTAKKEQTDPGVFIEELVKAGDDRVLNIVV